MRSTIAQAEILKQDARGRVRVAVERQQALLDEFERSGASGAKVARLAGIKYATFAGWVLKRWRQGGRVVKSTPILQCRVFTAMQLAGATNDLQAEDASMPSEPFPLAMLFLNNNQAANRHSK